ncbi:acyl carrier protein [Paenibacillus sp. 481]|uniref:acyl carrier protein n=1 Tax=Paenibacillus sp. 481 TaxID=2835869 RepID=UPI001E5F4045|nr:acyl carrier protein [Paenibacillus sp. 481]UHA72034.1 acyl carrier protein [Paenibacillus sp. 481]
MTTNLTSENTKEVIRTIVAEIAETTEFQDTDPFNETLNIDSMMVIEIVVRIEKAFKISIPESYIPRFTDLNESVLVVQEIASGEK